GYDVPLLLWSNKITKPQKIKATRTAKDFLHLFSEILEVKTENIQRNYKFISEDKSDGEIFIYDWTPQPKKYKNLKSNPVSTVFEK
ncbi:MAG: hypothetical protein KGV44_15140, partial [Flavobacteriaceae bacterium]|nr:hypothetical protein [Flavobacteriaceae bacterium]